MQKWIVPSLMIVVLGAIVFLLSLEFKGKKISSASNIELPRSESVKDEAVSLPQEKQPKVIAKTKEVMVVKEEEHLNIEEVKAHLAMSMTKHDPRSPKVTPPDAKFTPFKPSQEALNDPVKYAQYQNDLRTRRIQLYYPSKAQIEDIRHKIEEAQANGTRTEEEIQEAEAAIVKLEELRVILQEQGIPEPVVN